MRQRIESLEQFRALQAEYMAAREAEKRKILVCCGTGCVAGGNLNVYHELKKRMDELGIPCEVSLTEHHADTIGLKKSGCHGFCEMGPLVRIEPEGWLYTKCQVSDVEDEVNGLITYDRRVVKLDADTMLPISRALQDAMEKTVALGETELAAIAKVQEIFRSKNLIQCTGCRYCTDGCPKQIAIPELFATMNAKQIYHDW